MKLCKDCKHFEDNVVQSANAAFYAYTDIPKYLCHHPEFLNPVTGHGVDAEKMRDTRCGREGRFWEPKE